ncbi:MAG: hypothetical protein Q9191_001602 [Dirinaria sp. TL-2023a]
MTQSSESGYSAVAVECTVIALVLYTIYGGIYRLYLCPIARFPGRKLAALTFWYEFYFDVVKQGRYAWEIERMHETYGPIIRINPYELHVADPEFADQLYPTTAKNVEKWSWSASMLGTQNMTFTTVKHGVHRRRRGAFSKFFSKASVRRLQPVIQSLVDKLCDKLCEKGKIGSPTDMGHAYSALTQDVITEYCFANCRNVLEVKDFAPWYYELVQKASKLIHLQKQFPRLLPTFDLLPDPLVRATNPLMAQLRTQEKNYASQVQSILSHEDDADSKWRSQSTLFHSLRDDPELPPSEKSLQRLVQEAKSIVGAGTLPSTHLLSITTYHVLANETILRSLMAELKEVIPNKDIPCPLERLEQLPYLGAIINEGLRLSYGTLHRLQRVHPDRALIFQDWVIPPNTPVGMSSFTFHHNSAVFPAPETFDPSRWLGPEAEFRRKFLFSFGKGTRQCVGMNLALAESHMALAAIFRKLGSRMELYDTDWERDVDVKHDFFLPTPSAESRGVRVKIS